MQRRDHQPDQFRRRVPARCSRSDGRQRLAGFGVLRVTAIGVLAVCGLRGLAFGLALYSPALCCASGQALSPLYRVRWKLSPASCTPLKNGATEL